jgi:hypothetical protein
MYAATASVIGAHFKARTQEMISTPPCLIALRNGASDRLRSTLENKDAMLAIFTSPSLVRGRADV